VLPQLHRPKHLLSRQPLRGQLGVRCGPSARRTPNPPRAMDGGRVLAVACRWGDPASSGTIAQHKRSSQEGRIESFRTTTCR